ncbi:MAG: aromatic aminobenezylarsenical efflux permease ArsG family transporter [Bacteroidales bacterium]|nr:aromatic aminobenezylarsenical efflux permease ArsG family transporter [Bacteroidales bacterium]MDY3355163.1 aromatic aminobenezylarsenical efflux permease ArsG family transporter [Prevotella sp.]MCI7037834.1 aromatic aminobenezylarsenical efflux permease ArsG family transporter [Bacteroidales bacterium]MCI7559807.1 aromatic aminobenezylarsenical efflux permease ArsG family transporter [Bacteroidales bacterium]MCI7763761.1 aromatic aminobenezylarsenical efflux permease ArsG family transporte
MDILQTWLEGSEVPVLTAFLLGLLTAVSPCPLATNITAIGFISKDIESKDRTFLLGILYTIGRMVAYSLLGALLIWMLRRGFDTFDLQSKVSQWGEMLLSPVLIVMGLVMLFGDRLPLSGFGLNASEKSGRLRGAWGSLLLGILFAMAFCPTSGLFYFGMLIPMSASATGGYALPAVYALATGLPVVIVAWIIAYSIGNIAGFYKKMQVFQKWLNRMVAVLFIIVGIYYAYTFYL